MHDSTHRGEYSPPNRHADTMPLSEFPPELRDRIEREAAQPSPPERWLYVGGRGARPLAILESRGWWEWHWQRGLDPDRKRIPLPQWKRQRVIERDGLACGICGGAIPEDDVHIDHVYPVALGGSDEVDNLQVAHSKCNIRKGARI